MSQPEEERIHILQAVNGAIIEANPSPPTLQKRRRKQKKCNPFASEKVSKLRANLKDKGVKGVSRMQKEVLVALALYHQAQDKRKAAKLEKQRLQQELLEADLRLSELRDHQVAHLKKD